MNLRGEVPTYKVMLAHGGHDTVITVYVYCFLMLADPSINPDTLCLDGRFNHHTQLSSRLDYVR